MGGQRNALKLSMSPEERKLITFIIWGRAIRSGRGISKRIGGWMLTNKWVRFPYTPQICSLKQQYVILSVMLVVGWFG